MKTKVLSVLAVLAVVAAAGPAAAQAPADMADVDILPGWRADDGAHMAAVRVRLAPGWKTYWRAPGDAGIPPSFDFAGSTNVDSVSFAWPAPSVFHQNGLATIGYAHQLVLPMRVETVNPGAPARLRAEIDLGVCQDICVPITVDVAATLPATGGRPDARIRAALGDRPLSAAEAGAGTVRCDVTPSPRGVTVAASVALPSMGRGEIAVVELGNPDLWVSEAETHRRDGRLTAAVQVEPMVDGPVVIDRDSVRLTVIGPRGAVEIAGCE